VLALVQLRADAVDPESYAGAFTDPSRASPTNVLHLEGIGDGYNPNAAAEALTIALHAAPLAPWRSGLDALRAAGLSPIDLAKGNADGGHATIAAAQLLPTHHEDGHFVMYMEPEGATLARELFTRGFDPSPTFSLDGRLLRAEARRRGAPVELLAVGVQDLEALGQDLHLLRERRRNKERHASLHDPDRKAREIPAEQPDLGRRAREERIF
jgi:hypothetical protein